jgi:hypothetical protein
MYGVSDEIDKRALWVSDPLVYLQDLTAITEHTHFASSIASLSLSLATVLAEV